MPRAPLPEQLGALWSDNKKTLKCPFRFLFFLLLLYFLMKIWEIKKCSLTANGLSPALKTSLRLRSVQSEIFHLPE